MKVKAHCKKAVPFFLALVFLLLSVGCGQTKSQEPAKAEPDNIDYKYTVTDGEAYLTKYLGSESNVTIPDEIDGNPVVGIKLQAFKDCDFLISITIPECVKTTGGSVFEFCTSLENVTLPKGLTIIESRMFAGCTSLVSITIPEGVTKIGTGAFFGCKSLVNINLPEGLIYIENHAFDGCSMLPDETREKIQEYNIHAASGR